MQIFYNFLNNKKRKVYFMEHLLNENVKNLEISGIRKFFNLVSSIEGMISLTIGQPDFPTPLHVKEAGKQAIDNNFTTYTHNAGFIELRKAAVDFVKEKYNLHYNPDNEVIVTNGASQAIDATLRTILTPGDEVLLPGPIYPGYEPIISLCGAKPVHIDTTDNSFRLTADLIKPYITEKTKCVILPYPSNPTGVTLTKEELQDISSLLKGKDTFVLADEIYSELTFDDKHYSIASELPEQTIVINGLSKSHSMTGWRIGFLFAPQTICQHILKVHQYNVSCASSISQAAAYEALTSGIHDSDKMKEQYITRREFVHKRLQEIGFPQVIKPDGAFYFFVRIPPELSLSSFDFSLKLAQEQKVAVVPGSAFSSYGEGFFRLSYACSMELLEEGMDRIEIFFNQVTDKVQF
jgi:aminotransferase